MCLFGLSYVYIAVYVQHKFVFIKSVSYKVLLTNFVYYAYLEIVPQSRKRRLIVLLHHPAGAFSFVVLLMMIGVLLLVVVPDVLPLEHLVLEVVLLV